MADEKPPVISGPWAGKKKKRFLEMKTDFWLSNALPGVFIGELSFERHVNSPVIITSASRLLSLTKEWVPTAKGFFFFFTLYYGKFSSTPPNKEKNIIKLHIPNIKLQQLAIFCQSHFIHLNGSSFSQAFSGKFQTLCYFTCKKFQYAFLFNKNILNRTMPPPHLAIFFFVI